MDLIFPSCALQEFEGSAQPARKPALKTANRVSYIVGIILNFLGGTDIFKADVTLWVQLISQAEHVIQALSISTV